MESVVVEADAANAANAVNNGEGSIVLDSTFSIQFSSSTDWNTIQSNTIQQGVIYFPFNDEFI